MPLYKATSDFGLSGYFYLKEPTLFWLDMTVGLLLVAVTEELIFRKLALRWLEEAGRTPSQIVAISAVLFALIHWSDGPIHLFGTFLIGCIFMAVYRKLRRLWPMMFAHWLTNFAAFGGIDRSAVPFH